MNVKFKSGEYKTLFLGKEYEYNSFLPYSINRTFEWNDKRIPMLLEEASHSLGSLNECSLLVPDINTFIRMNVLKEATISTRIEGTMTEIEEAVLPEEEIMPEKRDDWNEVHNYINAMNYAVDAIKKIPLSMRLLKELHRIMLKGVRGEKKQPGEIRKSQNWIGGNTITDAHFVPPHFNELPTLLTDLEKFWNNDELKIPRILKVALTHYQFETIHPFLDGNGRIGRLLITLELLYYGILNKPILYISDFLEKNKNNYFSNLDKVRNNNEIDNWLIFFLTGITKTASNSKGTFEKVIKLRMKYEDKIRTLGRRARLGQYLLILLFSSPIIDISTVATKLGIAYNTAKSLLEEFKNLEMVKIFPLQKTKRKLFILWDYFNLYRT
jgi:Fic family protein